jgi:hypothetical protein
VNDMGAFNIDNGQSADTNTRAVIDAGVSNVKLGVNFVVITGQAWIITRFTDASNFLRVEHLKYKKLKLEHYQT